MSERWIVWVTGASQGLGAAIAESTPMPEARVVNIARRPHPRLENLCADLSERGDWSRIFDHFRQALASGEFDRALLVNNAVYQREVGLVGDIDAAELDKQLTVNVSAPLVLANALVRVCAERSPTRAGVIMVSSINAEDELPGYAAYGAAKAALEQWVRTLWAEHGLRPSTAQAVCVRPGSVDTPGLRAATGLNNELAGLAEEVKVMLGDRRAAQPADIAEQLWRAVWPQWPAHPVISLS